MDHRDVARSILDSVSYVVVSTADPDGTPWASPVWFAHDDYRTLYWVSAPQSRHSINLAQRASVAMVVFDSSAPALQGQAVYLAGLAAQVDDPADIDHGLRVYSERSLREGVATSPWGPGRVSGAARLRLYRARAEQLWILDPDSPIDERVAVSP